MTQNTLSLLYEKKNGKNYEKCFFYSTVLWHKTLEKVEETTAQSCACTGYEYKMNIKPAEAKRRNNTKGPGFFLLWMRLTQLTCSF